MLRRALSEGDVAARAAAARTLAQAGRPDDVEPLRSALTSSAPELAEAALDALAQISARYGLRIERVK
jgi:HEAT repeat protein